MTLLACWRFTPALDEIARRAARTNLERAAEAHAAECARCGARLAGGRALSAGLAALGAATADAEAPARVEAALLAAFRESASSRSGSPTTPRRTARRLWRIVAWAPAGGTAALLVWAALAPTRRPEPLPTAPPGAPLAEAGTPIATLPASASGVEAPPRLEARAPRPASRRPSPAAADPADAREEDPAPRGEEEDEVATPFLPLGNPDDLSVLDGAHVVRVRLPRNALVSWGWPVAEGDDLEPVSADVVLGPDGVAQAIRFVR